jgi:hypothetical protein
MEPLVLALTSRTVDGPLAPVVAAVSFAASLVLTAGLGWWASRLSRDRERRRRDDLAAATPVAGVH